MKGKGLLKITGILLIIIMCLLLCLCGCDSPLSASMEATSSPTPSAAQNPGVPPGSNQGPGNVGGAGTKGDVPGDPPQEKPQPPDAPKKEEPHKQEEPEKQDQEPEEEPGRSKVGATPKIVDFNKNWRIVGEGTQTFQMTGMPGENKMIVKLDLQKQGGATPAGTYTGKFSIWYYEMTPEMMDKYGITGDSHNEYETDSFTVNVIPSAVKSEKEWTYYSSGKEISVNITSITDVTVQGRKQQVTDHPSVTIIHEIELNPHTGQAEFTMELGPKTFIFTSGFRFESSGM